MSRLFRGAHLINVVPALLGVLACATAAARGGRARALWGFTEPSDARSARSVLAHGPELDVAVTGWITLDSATGSPRALYRDTVPRRGGGPRYFALVTSWQGEGFHSRPIRHLAADDSALGATAKGIARMVAAAGYDGVVLDFEALDPSDASALLKVAGVITDSVRGAGTRLVAMAVPAADTITYPTKALLGRVDALIVMLYDEHWPGSTPGPIASPEWARAWLGARVRQSGPERLIAAFPLYGYHWRRGQTRHVSYEEARGLAEGAQVPLSRDSGSHTLHAESADLGALWVSDVGLLKRLMADARSLGVGGIAFWYLGLEEAAFWTEVVRRDRAGSS